MTTHQGNNVFTAVRETEPNVFTGNWRVFLLALVLRPAARRLRLFTQLDYIKQQAPFLRIHGHHVGQQAGSNPFSRSHFYSYAGWPAGCQSSASLDIYVALQYLS